MTCSLKWAIAAALVTVGAAACASPPSRAIAVGASDRSNSTPWVATDGATVAVAWGATHDGGTNVMVAVSRDAGRTFAAPVQVNTIAGEARLGGELPPRVALVRADGSGSEPDVAVLWTARDAAAPGAARMVRIKTARSRDGGRSFEPPTELQSPGAPGDRGWPSLAIDSGGNAHAIWLDHRDMAAARARAPQGASHQHGGASDPSNSSLYYASAGAAPASERQLTRGVCYCCKTALATGADGSLYAAWRHVYPGDFRDMAFSASRDGGRSFSEPLRISEDGWAISGCPDDGPALAVDGRGTAHVAWPTVVGGAKPEGALFYASTADGRTFTPRLRIPTLGGPKPSHPQIAIDGSGRIVVAWDESVEGRRVAVLRELKPHPDREATFGSVVELNAEEAAGYPVLAPLGDGLIAVWTSGGDPSRVMARVIRLP